MSGQTWPPWILAPEPCLGFGSRGDSARPALAGRPPRRAQEAVGSQSTRSRAPGSWEGGDDGARRRAALARHLRSQSQASGQPGPALGHCVRTAPHL